MMPTLRELAAIIALGLAVSCNSVSEPCEPNCAGKECGGDGCGGSCSECPAAAPVCSVAGICEVGCAPECSGKQCGDDGCGGSCGSCANTTVCFAGACVEGCTPGATRCVGDDFETCGADAVTWTAISCVDDGNVCTDESCDPVSGCTTMNNTAACDDGDACTTGDVCGGGTCGGIAIDCDDGNQCTVDTCDSVSGCANANTVAACDDGDACTTGDVCGGGTCGGIAIDCDDGNQCTVDTCDSVAGCANANTVAACDDGDACTAGDVCGGGMCNGITIDCNDGNVCTDEICDSNFGCRVTNNAAACDDGVVCTGPDFCSGGVCQPGPDAAVCGNGLFCPSAEACDDGNTSANDACAADCQSVTEFHVNTTSLGAQFSPAVAMAADGAFVVVWADDTADGSGRAVFGQRFGSLGNAMGPEFQVNTTTIGEQDAPDVAMHGDGSFVVVWQGQVSGIFEIFARRYATDGSSLGGEVLVNTTSMGDQTQPRVAADAGGGFGVVWSSSGQDGSGLGTYGQRFNSSGTTVGNEFQLNTTSTSNQAGPCVGFAADGSFVTAWRGWGSSGDGVYGRLFTSTGVASSNEFQISTSWNSDPNVAVLSDGSFVVVWEQSPIVRDILMRRYDATGAALGSEVLVNTFTTGVQGDPVVDVWPDGRFAISWWSIGQDEPNGGIFAQRFDAAGVPAGGEIQVASSGYDQMRPAIATSILGPLLIAWQSSGQGGSGWEVIARFYPE